MKKLTRYISGFFCLCTIFSVPSGAVDKFVITLSEPSKSLLDCSSAEELDSVLYPSGMELPTKYLDASIFTSSIASYTVSSETLEWITTHFPADSYTFAEIRAAEMYLFVEKVFSEEEAGSSADAILEFYDSMGVEGFPGSYSLEIAVWDAFHSYINSLLSPSTEPSLDSWDFAFASEDIVWTEPPSLYVSEEIAEFFNFQSSLLPIIGLSFVYSSAELATYSFNQESELDVQQGKGRADPIYVSQTSDINTSKEAPVDRIDDKNYTAPANKSVSDFVLVKDSNVPVGIIGPRDIILVVALIFCSVCAIIFSILDWIRKRRDPTLRYKR